MQHVSMTSYSSHAAVASSAATTFLGTPVSVHTRGHGYASCSGAHYQDEDKYNPVHQEQSMWRAVIVQALMDASSTSQKTEALVWRREAQTWLRGTTPDFATVCFYANMDPDFVREVAAKALSNNCIWRAAPGTGPMKHDPRRAKAKNPRHFTQRR